MLAARFLANAAAMRAMTRFLNGLLAKAWFKWREMTQHMLYTKDMVSVYLNRIRMGDLQRAWNKWRDVFLNDPERLAALAMMAKALSRWLNRQLTGAYNRWREWYAEILEQRRILEHAMNMWMKGQLRNAWNSWMYFTRLENYNKGAFIPVIDRSRPTAADIAGPAPIHPSELKRMKEEKEREKAEREAAGESADQEELCKKKEKSGILS